jgi:cytochrome P450
MEGHNRMVDFDALVKLPPAQRIRELYEYFDGQERLGAVATGGIADTWEVFRHEEAMAVLSDFETFSSDKTGRIPEEQAQLARAARGNFIGLDPPLHNQMRALVNKAFTPRVVADLEPRVREIAEALLDEAVATARAARQDEAGGEVVTVDLARDYASRLSAAVIAELFGIPQADHERFWTWSDVLIGARPVSPDGTVDQAELDRFNAMILDASAYLMTLIAEHRKEPGGDLTSQLTQVEVDGERLVDDEIFGIIGMFIIAGHVAASVLIGNVLMCLAEHPDAMAEVRADESLLPGAIEETLRWRPPLVRDQRVARRDAEVGGTTIPAGKSVCVWLAAVNRDERIFADPDRFDIRRSPNPHRSFGKGIHYCLGAPLARLETEIALTTLFRRTEELTVLPDAGDGFPALEFHASVGLIGPVHLPVALRLAEAAR